MFQFSLDCAEFELPILRRWLAHFDSVGRPAAIVKAGNGRFAYSVWRDGKMIVGNGPTLHEETDTPARGSKIVESVRGFNFSEIE
jgi:hypothetical protein